MGDKLIPNLYLVTCYRCGHKQKNVIKNFRKYKFLCKNKHCLATRKNVVDGFRLNMEIEKIQ